MTACIVSSTAYIENSGRLRVIAIHPILELPAHIAEGLATGQFTRWGGVIRIATGYDGAGQIVAHLRDLGPAAQQLAPQLGSLLGMTSVGAAASVVGLGVTAAGFFIMNRKLNRLQRSMDAIDGKLDRLSQNLEDGFGCINDTLIELRYLATVQTELMKESLCEIRGLREDLVFDKLASIESWLVRLQRNPDCLGDALCHFEQARRALGYMLGAQLPSIQQRQSWPAWLLRYRVWCMAGGLEISALRRAGHDEAATETAYVLAQSARNWARHWLTLLTPEFAFGSAAFVGHSVFANHILPEVGIRLARLELGVDLDRVAFLDWRRTGALQLARELRGLDEQWLEQQASGMRLLDFMAESSERLESLASEMKWCHQQKIDHAQWETLGAGLDGMVLITQETQ